MEIFFLRGSDYAARLLFPDLVEQLIAAGADVNVIDEYQNNALHYACRFKSEISEEFISRFPEKDRDAVRKAAELTRDYPEKIALMLINAGCDGFLKDQQGNSPLDLAEKNGFTAVVEAIKKQKTTER